MCSCQAAANRKAALQGSANHRLSLWGGSRGTTQAVGRISRRGKDTSQMISLGLLLVGLGLVQAGHHNHVLSEHFIEQINAANSTWRAGRNFHPETSHNFLRALMGVHPMAHKHLPPPKPALLGETSFLFPCVKVFSFLCVKVAKDCRRILTRGRNGQSVQRSARSETRGVVALAGPLGLSLPCPTASASTRRGTSMCTCPAKTSSLAATPADLDATVAFLVQPGVSGAGRVW